MVVPPHTIDARMLERGMAQQSLARTILTLALVAGGACVWMGCPPDRDGHKGHDHEGHDHKDGGHDHADDKKK